MPRLGGVELHQYQLAQCLRALGHYVIVVTGSYTPPPPPHLPLNKEVKPPRVPQAKSRHEEVATYAAKAHNNSNKINNNNNNNNSSHTDSNTNGDNDRDDAGDVSEIGTETDD